MDALASFGCVRAKEARATRANPPLVTHITIEEAPNQIKAGHGRAVLWAGPHT